MLILMLADTREQHGQDAPCHQPEKETGKYVADTSRLHGNIRLVRLRHPFQVDLLSLGFISGLFQRSECGPEQLLGKSTLQRQTIVVDRGLRPGMHFSSHLRILAAHGRFIVPSRPRGRGHPRLIGS